MATLLTTMGYNPIPVASAEEAQRLAAEKEALLEEEKDLMAQLDEHLPEVQYIPSGQATGSPKPVPSALQGFFIDKPSQTKVSGSQMIGAHWPSTQP